MRQFPRTEPILFAHRGGRAHRRENTLEAFRHALTRPVTGVESDVWLSADGVPILDHDGMLQMHDGSHRRPGVLRRDAMPTYVPSVADLYALVGSRVDVQLDLKDVAALPLVLEAARAAGALQRLWLAHSGYLDSDWQLVALWRQQAAGVGLLDSTSVSRFDVAPREYARRAAAAGIDVINLPAGEWTPYLVDVVREAGLGCFAFNAHHTWLLDQVLALGVDAVYGDHIERMLASADAAGFHHHHHHRHREASEGA